ncbi:MAG TPA: hypothetical protein VHB18_15415 [Mycobacteriales bacterium]|jgi:hypothetical protein|nr:hypothetical protein [Mycobacteriales bacterium]
MHPDSRHRRVITTFGILGASVGLALATALPAMADPPAGHGGGNSDHVPPGQARQSPAPDPAGTATAPTPTASATHVAPGQAKKAAKGDPPGQAKKAGKADPPGRVNHPPANGGNGSAHNPPGNNGTVKVHSVAGDVGHHNVAHVGCSFTVDFWGFDQGQTLNVSFTGQAPTGMGTPVVLGAPDGTTITSPDPAGGGNDYDGELRFVATPDALAVLGAPAKQGYHLRLTVDTHQGGGHKTKVFWVEPCVPDTPPTPTTSTTSSTSTTTSSGLTRPPVTTDATPPLELRHVTLSHAVPPQRQRVHEASPPTTDTLAFTGADISALFAAGVVTVAAGVMLTVAGRRRRKIGWPTRPGDRCARLGRWATATSRSSSG